MTVDRRLPRWVWALAVALVGVHLATDGWRYGHFRDELYFLACGRHLAFGYVDQPPMIALFAWLLQHTLGESLFAIRLLPAIAAGAKVVLTAALARELGGAAFAIALACVCVAAAPIYLGTDALFTMNCFEPLCWMGCALIVARIANGAPGREWLGFGVIAGLGLENKHSMAFFGGAIVVGLLATPMRAAFRERWIWLGGAIALAIAAPNLAWEATHGWATWELLRNVARSGKNVQLSPLGFVAQQLLLLGPLSAPVWIWGEVALLRDAKQRALGIAWIAALLFFVAQHGKSYYLAPSYPTLYAAGAVAIERAVAQTAWRAAIVAVILGGAAPLVPLVLPILPPARLGPYAVAMHASVARTETGHTADMPQIFADQFGWEELARSVGAVWQQLPPEDRARAGVFAQNYGDAGALDLYGPRYGLPPALSGHQSYFLWGPRGADGSVMLVLDDDADDERGLFDSVEDAGPVESSPYAMPFEQRQHVWICRGLHEPLDQLWPKLKQWL